jgi:hypothetical protein
MKSIVGTQDEGLSIIFVQSCVKHAEVCGLCHKIREDGDGNRQVTTTINNLVSQGQSVEPGNLCSCLDGVMVRCVSAFFSGLSVLPRLDHLGPWL